MEKQELAPHVSEIARVLGNKIDEKDIEKELDTYLNLYRVSLETAKRSVVRKLGGDPNGLTRGVRKLIAELSGTEMSVDLLVKVLTVNHKDIEQSGSCMASWRMRVGASPTLPGMRRDSSWNGARCTWSGTPTPRNGTASLSSTLVLVPQLNPNRMIP
jgi:hypothetical protein